MKLRHQRCPFLHPKLTSWWAGKDISLLSLCLMTLMQHMTLLLAQWIGWDWCRLMINDHFIIWMLNRTTLLPPGSILLISFLAIFYIVDTLLMMLLQNICLYGKMENYSPSGIHTHSAFKVHFVNISILTWLPSRCQKTVGWGLPLVSQGNVAVRPCATIWSRGRTTNWGASEVKGKINHNTIATHLDGHQSAYYRRTSLKGKYLDWSFTCKLQYSCTRT